MKSTELWIYGALLVGSVAFAHSTWKGEEPVAVGDVVLFEPTSAGLTSVDWTGERSAAQLEVSGKGDDADVWVSAGKRKRLPVVTPEPAAGDDDSASDDDDSAADVAEVTPAEPPKAKYGEPELTSFPGNRAAVQLVQRMSPLHALRRFDGLSVEELEGMGLAEPKSTLVLRSGDRTMTLEVGAKSYGSSDAYVREPGSDTVYLLSSKDLGPLRSASTSLRDRSLLGFEPTDAVGATVQTPAAPPLQAAHQGRHDKDNSFWTRPDTPDERDSVLDGLMKSALQLNASGYLKAEEMPAEETLEVVVEFGFVGERGPLGKLELGRARDEKRSSDDDVVYVWYARSHRTRGTWAKISKSSAEEVTDALAGLLGG